MLNLMMRSWHVKLIPVLVLIFMVAVSLRLGATSYQGVSTTNPGAALFYTTLQRPNDGDSYSGFVGFGGGLAAPGSGNITIGTVSRLNTCLYSAWPATITLSDDLLCNSIFRFSGGSAIQIYGSGYTLKLTGSLGLDGATNLTALSNLVVDGQGNRVTLSGDAALIYDTAVSVTLRNMTLVLKAQYPFCPKASSSSLTLDNVKVVMSPSFATYFAVNPTAFAGTGIFAIEKNVKFVGSGATFVYNAPQTLGIASGAALTFDSRTTFSYYCGYRDRVYMSDQTSTFRLNNCTLSIPPVTGGGITTAGMQLKNGMVEFDNRIFIENGGQSSVANGLILGDGLNTANNVAVSILSGANVIVDGVMYYNQA